MRIEYHRTLIADQVRNAAIYAALKAVIRKGETVVADVGAGTGLIGLMALKLGARHVYLYEAAEVAGVAAAVLKTNRAKGATLLPGHSTEMLDPPKVDVIVSETLGNYALEENIIETLNDARERMLKPGGIIIPRALAQYAAPVVSPRIHDELTAWRRVGFGIDLEPAQVMSLNNVYVRALTPADLMPGAEAVRRWDDIDLTRSPRANRKGEITWAIAKPTTIFGFGVWWSADLGAGVELSTAPGAPETHWEQLYFPLLTPITARKGDSVMLSLRSRSSEAAGTHLAWTALHRETHGETLARQAMDLDKGWIP